MEAPRHVLVSGATGYIGGRLVPVLLACGHAVRCLVRDPSRLAGRPWLERVEVVRGDVLDRGGLEPALAGCEAAFYLVHSMGSGRGFEERDLAAARTFGAAAAATGVARIIYLGGLGDPEAALSPHLRSRQATGAELGRSGVPVTELRAAVVVGSGSLSFEMIRNLTERLPVMVCPRWVYTRVQPIAVDDVLAYLAATLKEPESAGRVIEIGGADVVTYGDMMLGYARARGLRRRLIPVPVLSPRLSSHWVYWVTPIPRAVAQPLIEGLRNEVVVRDDVSRRLFSDIVPLDYAAAVRRALDELAADVVATSWSDALATSQGDVRPVDLTVREGMIVERRELDVGAPAADVFAAVSRVGGVRGWPYLNAAWRLRGLADRAVGGVGLRRGRRDADELRIGDALDFWRVEAVAAGRLLRLRAEMRLPGEAWLQFEVRPRGEEAATLAQTAYFAPRGLGGLAYWYVLYPVHRVIFSGMIARLAQQACRVGALPTAPDG